jgi:transcription-repair coupling factor (superfamily II helicase)
MVRFLHKEVDVLVCTTIVESGIDIPNANTMFIDNAHTFGLSQLYQLRGRVGRSKQRAYCYLLIPENRKLEPDAQERLKVIQENTALGSGLVIAQHDLELRGAGTLLGEDQSGQIEDVGYEMFLELLEEALQEAKGEEIREKIDPEINLRIPALIPTDYIPDIRIRLSFYRRLSEIQTPQDVDLLEDEMRDQFGRLPDPVLNLMGIMLIKSVCRDLSIRDLSSGNKSLSLIFSEKTQINVESLIRMALKDKHRFTLTPDNKLVIKLAQLDWPTIYEELLSLRREILT